MGRTRKNDGDSPSQITSELSTDATRITSKGVSKSDPAPTSAENPNLDKAGTTGG